MRTEKVIIDRFDGSMSGDVRGDDYTKSRLCKNFDHLTYPRRLVPHRSSESGNDTVARKITEFTYLNGRTYGLGNPSNVATVYFKDNYTNDAWSTTSNNVSIADLAGSIGSRFFIYYRTTDRIYFPIGGGTISTYDPSGTNAMTSTFIDFSLWSRGTTAIIHSKDDIMYFSYYHPTSGAIVGLNNNGAFTNVALTLGPRYVISNFAEYGNFLAIGCRQVDQLQGSSRVFLWDRDVTLATVSESIDAGLGNLQILEEIEGYLIIVSLLYESSVVSETRLIAQYYAGAAGFKPIETLVGTITGFPTVLYSTKQKSNRRIYFMHAAVYDGEYQAGVWSIGRNTDTRQFGLALERSANNDTGVSSLDGFHLSGEYMFIAYNGAGAMSKTDDSLTTYSATSVYETLVNPRMKEEDKGAQKQLKSVRVNYAPLPTAGQVVLEYKVDNVAYSNVFTETENSVVFTETTTGASGQFSLGRQYQFKVKSTGGAEITSIEYEYEVDETL